MTNLKSETSAPIDGRSTTKTRSSENIHRPFIIREQSRILIQFRERLRRISSPLLLRREGSFLDDKTVPPS